MKTIFNKQKKSIVGIVTAMLAFAIAFTGCQRDFELDLPLAVSSRDLSLTKEAGSTHVLVYSNGDWTAHLTRAVKWASINKTEGYGNHEIVFSYSANYGISRKVGVVFTKGNMRDTVMFTQAGSISEPSLVFSKSAVTLLRSSATVKSALSTNLRYCIEDVEATVTYYDEEGLANDPIPVVTRADEGEKGEGEGEGEGDETPKAEPVEPWIANVAITHNAVTFDVVENPSSFPRRADLTIFIEDAEGTVTQSVLSITQGISNPAFKLDESEVTYEGYAQDCVVEASNNNIVPYADQVEVEVTYSVEPEEEWITKISVTDEGLVFSLKKNEGASSREAVINLWYADELGNEIVAKCKVVQKMYPAAIDFASVRALTPGEIKLQQYIEGFVISDRDSKNLCSSPQTAQFKFDRAENNKTAYIESTDAQYGFCLKFETDTDAALLERFSKVRIAVDGLTLEKHADPEYYTIKGLTAANILEATTPDEFKVPVKTKRIAEFTDDDIFTLVSVPDLEIMQKDGSFTNASEGYLLKDENSPSGTSTPRYDVCPLLCYDTNGNTINMLTNCAVPWRRDGKDLAFYSVVPQGSGTFRGVVVADDIVTVRYGNVGRYQLRAMTKEEIALNEAPFSKTIVEWTWEDRKNDLIPERGAGEIIKYGATQVAASDFNNTYHCNGNTSETNGGGTNQKGLVVNGGTRLDNTWWDFTNNVGKYFDISFSTAGISGNNMVFGIVWGAGDMGGVNIKAPANWNLLYSVDGGETFKPVPNSDPIKCRCIVWWSTTPQDCAPGFTEHLRKLPAECFGKEKVVLRLQAASTVTNIDPKATSSNYKTALACEKGNIVASTTAANQQIRIGTITVRYN